MKDDSTHIRLKVATRERLLVLIASLTMQAERGSIGECRDNLDNPNPAANAVSFDGAINFLLDMRDNHHERAARAATKRKSRKQENKDMADNLGSSIR